MLFFIIGLIAIPSILAQHGAVYYVSAVLCRQSKSEGFSCALTTPSTYYYFDYDLRDCLAFVFEGCGGNGNRFVTKQQCLHGCGPLRQCSQGDPLTDSPGVNYRRCSIIKPCPKGYECLQDEYRPHSTLCCPAAARICHESVTSGNHCSGVNTASWYFFDASVNVCREFNYFGCGGNENRFKTNGACLQFCADSITCLVGEPWLDSAQSTRVNKCVYDQHCPKNYTCTKRKQKTACCPSRDFICQQSVDTGAPCRHKESSGRWYFDSNRGLCRKFDYSGCDGNLNNFVSLDQCTEFCFGSCLRGSLPHINSYTGQPQLCTLPLSDSCPAGFECQSNSEQVSVCCKTAPRCPKPESTILYENDSPPDSPKAVTCIPEVKDSCKSGYQCVKAPNKEYVCCTAPIECPHGMEALRDFLDGRPHFCSHGVPGTCPKQYGCVASKDGRENVCCKPIQLCLMPFMDPISSEPRTCSPSQEKCPFGTYCLPTPTTEQNNHTLLFYNDVSDLDYFCCHDVKYYSCPDGSVPYLDVGGVRPRDCIYGDPNSCPLDFNCHRLDDGTYGCCKGKFKTKPCLMAYADPNKGLINCSGWTDQSCPTNTTCLLATNNKYYCCSK